MMKQILLQLVNKDHLEALTCQFFVKVGVACVLSLPLATQEDVEAEVAKVADLEETEFAAEPRDAKSFVQEAIAKVRDLEETDFAAEPRDAEVDCQML